MPKYDSYRKSYTEYKVYVLNLNFKPSDTQMLEQGWKVFIVYTGLNNSAKRSVQLKPALCSLPNF